MKYRKVLELYPELISSQACESSSKASYFEALYLQWMDCKQKLSFLWDLKFVEIFNSFLADLVLTFSLEIVYGGG